MPEAQFVGYSFGPGIRKAKQLQCVFDAAPLEILVRGGAQVPAEKTYEVNKA